MEIASFAIFDDDDDRRVFMTTVDRAVWQYGVRVFAWCLMPNHYHLVVDTPRGNLSDAMRHVNGVYTQATNRLHQRTGHVFEGRFKSFVVQQESYLRRVARYIVLNPVRAHLVTNVADWRWSSYRATAGLDPAPGICRSTGFHEPFQTRRPRPPAAVRDVRGEPRGAEGRARCIAGRDWRSVVRATLREAVREHRPDGLLPFAHRALGRPSLDELLTPIVTRNDRNARIVRAHVQYGYTMAAIASVLGVHPSTVSLVLRRVELETQRLGIPLLIQSTPAVVWSRPPAYVYRMCRNCVLRRIS